MSHEESITVKNKRGRWVNLSTHYRGAKLSPDAAQSLYESGDTRALPTERTYEYDSVDEAVKGAKDRSSRSKHLHGNELPLPDPELLNPSTKGSPPFTKEEIRRGYRVLSSGYK